MVKVLIIDDQELSRKALRLMLSKVSGFQFLEAENGKEALEVMESNAPDLILLDVLMPVMDGKTFLAAIRKTARYEHIPVIVLSAVGERTLVNEMTRYSIVDYVLKPVEKQALFQTVIKSGIPVSVADLYGTSRLDGKKILLATTDDDFNLFVKDLLDQVSDLHICNNGSTALQLFLEHSPDIVLLGEQLPGMNEDTLAQKIRDLDVNGVASIFLLTPSGATAGATGEAIDGVLKKIRIPKIFMMNLMRHFSEQKQGNGDQDQRPGDETF